MHSAAPTQAFGGWGGYVSYVDNYVDNYVATWSPPADELADNAAGAVSSLIGARAVFNPSAGSPQAAVASCITSSSACRLECRTSHPSSATKHGAGQPC